MEALTHPPESHPSADPREVARLPAEEGAHQDREAERSAVALAVGERTDRRVGTAVEEGEHTVPTEARVPRLGEARKDPKDHLGAGTERVVEAEASDRESALGGARHVAREGLAVRG